MSSKNSGTQGRRTPLTLSQTKMSQQFAPQGKRASTSSNETQDMRMKQSQPQPQQQQPQQKKEEKKEANVVASAAGPVPIVNVAQANVQQAKPTANMNNGYNGADTNGVSNGNKSGNSNDNKKEIETRNKTAKQAKIAEEQPKNGTEVATKETSASPSSRKQQQLQQKQEKDEQTANNMKAPSTPNSKKQVEVKVDNQKSSPAAAKKADNKEDNDVIIIDDQNEEKKEGTIKTTPKKQAVVSENSKKDELKQPEPQKEKEKEKVDVDVKATTVAAEVAPVKVTPVKVTPTKKFSVTGTIDNEEMETSPIKTERNKHFEPLATAENPRATSTPGKVSKAMGISTTPARVLSESGRNLMITGRRSIRQLNDFENNSEYRGSYRRVKTELDMTNESNSSLNVTVGSEPGNNTSWFSFRSRKRDRTPAVTEPVQEELMSPPKRARFGLFSIMASPITALRSRFAKTTLDALETSKIEEQDEHNGSMDEDVSLNEVEDLTPIENSPQKKTSADIQEEKKQVDDDIVAVKSEKIDILAEGADVASTENGDISLTAYKRRCNVM